MSFSLFFNSCFNDSISFWNSSQCLTCASCITVTERSHCRRKLPTRRTVISSSFHFCSLSTSLCLWRILCRHLRMIGSITNQMSTTNGIEGQHFCQNSVIPLECNSLNCVDSIPFLASVFSVGAALEFWLCSRDGVGVKAETGLHSGFMGFNSVSRTKNTMHSAIKDIINTSVLNIPFYGYLQSLVVHKQISFFLILTRYSDIQCDDFGTRHRL